MRPIAGLTRQVRTAAAALVAMLMVVGSRAGAAPAGALRVGFLAPMTGLYAPTGREMVDGFNLYLRQHDGRLGGRSVQLVGEDTQLNPGVALTKARKLASSDRVQILAGLISSPATYALREFVDSRQLPTVISVAAGDDITQRQRARYMVRLGWGSSSQAAHVFGEYAAGTLGYRRVATIADDFAFGHEWVGGFQRTFEAAGGQVVKKLWTPLGTADFSVYLAQIPADVDAVVAAVVGPPAIRFLKQYADYGYHGRVPLIGPGHMSDESILSQMGAEAEGLVTVLHYAASLASPANQAFVKAFTDQAGHAPSAYAEAGYTTARWLDQALQDHPGELDGPAMLKAIRSVGRIEAPRGPVALDAYGNVVHNIYIRRTERAAPGGALVNRVVATFPEVSQFWKFDPEQFLRQPAYSRDNPPCSHCRR